MFLRPFLAKGFFITGRLYVCVFVGVVETEFHVLHTFLHTCRGFVSETTANLSSHAVHSTAFDVKMLWSTMSFLQLVAQQVWKCGLFAWRSWYLGMRTCLYSDHACPWAYKLQCLEPVDECCPSQCTFSPIYIRAIYMDHHCMMTKNMLHVASDVHFNLVRVRD